jgi:hypothetical protein
MVEHLSSKPDTLSSTPSSKREKKKKRFLYKIISGKESFNSNSDFFSPLPSLKARQILLLKTWFSSSTRHFFTS